MNLIKNKKLKLSYLVYGLILFALFLIVSSALAVVCGIPSGTGCGNYGANAPGGFSGPAPSCDMCACYCGWYECCSPPGAGGPHLSFLWDGVNCGCPTGGGGGKECRTEDAIKSQIKKLMEPVGKETCSEWISRAWQGLGWGNLGENVAGMMENMTAWTGTANLPVGSIIIIGSGQHGQHVVMWYGNGWVAHDPGFEAGAPRFELLAVFKGIMGAVRPPVQVVDGQECY